MELRGREKAAGSGSSISLFQLLTAQGYDPRGLHLLSPPLRLGFSLPGFPTGDVKSTGALSQKDNDINGRIRISSRLASEMQITTRGGSTDWAAITESVAGLVVAVGAGEGRGRWPKIHHINIRQRTLLSNILT